MGTSVNIMEHKYLSDIINTVGDLEILSITSELSYGMETRWTLELSSDTKPIQNETEKSLPMTNKEINMKLNLDSTGMSNALQASLYQGIQQWSYNPKINEYCCCDYIDITNQSNQFQGNLRYAPFNDFDFRKRVFRDYNQASDALKTNDIQKSIFLTHVQDNFYPNTFPIEDFHKIYISKSPYSEDIKTDYVYFKR